MAMVMMSEIILLSMWCHNRELQYMHCMVIAFHDHFILIKESFRFSVFILTSI
jgi:hypothetical protein